MKAAVFEQFGEPEEVLDIRVVPEPTPGPGEVRVRMVLSPVNPSDLLVVRGRYGVLPKLPATPGFEGVGIVEKAGPGFLGKFYLGKRVAVLNGRGGNWAEYVVIPAQQAVPVPKHLPDEQVASFFVNPVTVLAMVRHVLGVKPGEWLLQSAAGSVLGKMVIRLGKHAGFKTINVVRRSESKDELLKLGADAVISSSEGPIADQVRSIVGPAGVKYALDPVGGETGEGVFESLGESARMLCYGTLSNEPIRIDSRRMIAGRRVIEGFWLGHWMRDFSRGPAGKLRALALFREIAKLIGEGVLVTETGPTFGFDDIKRAVAVADQVGRGGKVFVRLDLGG